MQFAELVCELTQLDLTEFFEAWNIFTPYVGKAKDYHATHIEVNLTEQLVEETKARIKSKNYSKPAHSVQYITDGNIDLYKNNTRATCEGTTISSDKKIKVKGAKGVVAYEVELDGKVISISSKDEWEILPKEYIKDISKLKLFMVSSHGERRQVTLSSI